jgi:Zn-dependent M28 family amino/carboxypeptidase
VPAVRRGDARESEHVESAAELPGATKRDEAVMIDVHFDSWHTGTAAPDNAAGSAVTIEVMHILKSLDLRMDRTVRLAWWGLTRPAVKLLSGSR